MGLLDKDIHLSKSHPQWEVCRFLGLPNRQTAGRAEQNGALGSRGDDRGLTLKLLGQVDARRGLQVFQRTRMLGSDSRPRTGLPGGMSDAVRYV